jgi:hypothetical protein
MSAKVSVVGIVLIECPNVALQGYRETGTEYSDSLDAR